jgi:hypothetical protein
MRVLGSGGPWPADPGEIAHFIPVPWRFKDYLMSSLPPTKKKNHNSAGVFWLG